MSTRGQRARPAHLTMRRLEQRAHDLHEREYEGETAATPLLAVAGIVLFLVPVVLLVGGTALALYYLA